MNLLFTDCLSILVTGIGATAMLDLWTFLRKSWFGVPAPDYGLVSRWMAGMLRGQFRHQSIAAASPVSGELLIGWVAHYLIGIAYAVLLVLLFGREWLQQPSIGPALLVGIVTVAAPFFIMQPGMGAGIAASRTPNPNAARLHRLVSHAIFGLGMYASALMARPLFQLTLHVF